MKVFTNKY